MKRVEKNVEPIDKKVKREKCMHDHHPSEPPGAAHEALYRLVLEVVARLEN